MPLDKSLSTLADNMDVWGQEGMGNDHPTPSVGSTTQWLGVATNQKQKGTAPVNMPILQGS